MKNKINDEAIIAQFEELLNRRTHNFYKSKLMKLIDERESALNRMKNTSTKKPRNQCFTN